MIPELEIYRDILAFLEDRTGLDSSALGPAHIGQVIRQRMAKTAKGDKTAYLDLLRSSGVELDAFLDGMLIPETWFFRDRGPFDLLFRHASALVKAGGPPHGRMFRVLSLACSTGEEPYSIAVTLLEAGLSPTAFAITAVDIRKSALEVARRGLYGKPSLRGQEPPFLGRYVKPTASDDAGGFAVDPVVRAQVAFIHGSALDLDLQAHEAPYDVVFCRNLLIYLTEPARDRLRLRVRSCLGKGGLFFAGHAEGAPAWGAHLVRLPDSLAFAFMAAPGKQGPPR